jgi:hypothetical protein
VKTRCARSKDWRITKGGKGDIVFCLRAEWGIMWFSNQLVSIISKWFLDSRGLRLTEGGAIDVHPKGFQVYREVVQNHFGEVQAHLAIAFKKNTLVPCRLTREETRLNL